MNWMRRWQKAAGGLAAALLLPVPAMATLTFNGTGWTVKKDVQTGGPTPPDPLSSITDSVTKNGQAEATDVLTFDMGDYAGATKNTNSTLELTRSITLSSSNELVEFAHQATAQFAQAGTNVQVHLRNSNGGGDVIGPPINFNFNTPSKTLMQVQQNQATFNSTIKAGTYLLDVIVTYTTNNKIGQWKTVSQDRFTFTGF